MVYEDYEKDNGIRAEDRFAVIDNFSLIITIGLLATPRKCPATPLRKLKCDIRSLQFRVTPKVYGYLLSIPKVFFLDEDDGVWRELTQDRKEIMRTRKIAGIVKKRGNGLTKYWYNYHCYLAEGYLYFYEINKHHYLDSYFYLKNTVTSFGKNELGIENTLILRNKVDQCSLAFSSAKLCNTWKEKIDEMVEETSLLSEGMYKKITEVVDLRNAINEVKAKVGELLFELFDDKENLIVKGDLQHLQCSYIKRQEDIMMKVKVYNFKVFHPDNKHFKRILHNESDNDFLSLTIAILSNKSPDFKGELLVVAAQLGGATIYYPPELIKTLLQFLRESDPEGRTVFIEEAKDRVLERKVSFDEEWNLEKSVTCLENAEVIVNANITVDTIKVHCLHSTFDTLLTLFEVDSISLDYTKYNDHEVIKTKIGNMSVYDLTNYPDIMPPKNFNLRRIKPQRFISIKSAYYNDKYACTINMTIYKPYCPRRPLTTENFANKIEVKVDIIEIELLNSQYLNCIGDYVKYQLLPSLTPKKPNQSVVVEVINQSEPFTSIEVIVDKPLVYLRPRSHYENYFLIDLGNIHVWNERQWLSNRWLQRPTQKLLCDVFHVDITALTISYSRKYLMLDSCHFFIQADIPCIKSEENKSFTADVLDQSTHIRVEVPKMLKFRMKSEQLAYLMECLDLNIGYKADIDGAFSFKSTLSNEVKGGSEEGDSEKGMSFDVKCNFPIISFLVIDSNNTNLAEFDIKDINASIIGNKDSSMIIVLGIASLYALHDIDIDNGIKDTILAPLSSNDISVDYYTNDDNSTEGTNTNKLLQVNLHILKDKTTIIDISFGNHRIYLQLYFMMLLARFLIDSLPSYDDPKESSKKCNTSL